MKRPFWNLYTVLLIILIILGLMRGMYALGYMKVQPMFVCIRECELECLDSYEEDTDTITSSMEIFKVGDKADFYVLEDRQFSMDVQFGDGSMAFSVPKDYFIKVE